ncbi:MAG: hypothetical protein ACFFCW_00145 [Candidatus Hodarchaeota archaeon]
MTLRSIIPDIEIVQEAIQPGMQMLMDGRNLLPSATDLQDNFENAFNGLKGLVPEEIDKLDELIEGLNNVGRLIPENPTSSLGLLSEAVDAILEDLGEKNPFSLLEQLDTALKDVEGRIQSDIRDIAGPFADALIESQQILREAAIDQSVYFLRQVETFPAQIPNTVNELLAFLHAQLENIARFIEDGASSTVQEIVEQKDNLKIALDAQRYETFVQQIQDTFVNVAEQLNTIDINDEAAYQAVLSGLQGINNNLEQIRQDLPDVLNQISDGIDLLDAIEIQGQIQFQYERLLTLESRNLQNVLNAALPVLGNLRGTVESISLNQLQTDLTGFLENLKLLIEGFNVSEIANEITSATDYLNQQITNVDQALLKAAIPLQDLSSQIAGALEDLDLGDLDNLLSGVFDELEQKLSQVKQAFEDLRTNLNEAFNNLSQAVSPEELQNLIPNIEQFFNDLKQGLDDLKIEESIQQTKQGLMDMLTALEGINFQAAADTVIEQIENMKGELENIDPSALSQALQIMLAAAVEVLRQIAFDEIRDVLVVAFDEVKEIPVDAAKQITNALEEVKSKIEAIEPAKILEPLSRGREELQQALDDVKPAKLLEPLNPIFDEAFTALDKISPLKLTQQMDEVYQNFLSIIDQINPDQVLGELTESILPYIMSFEHDIVEVAEWIEEMARTLESARESFEEISPDQYLQPLTEEWEQVRDETITFLNFADSRLNDMKSSFNQLSGLTAEAVISAEAQMTTTIQTGYTQIVTAIATIAPEELVGGIRDALNDLLNELDRINPEGMVLTLVPHHTTITNAFGNINPGDVPSNLRPLYDEIEQLIDNTNPLTCLSPISGTYNEIAIAISNLSDALQSADLEDLYNSLKPQMEAFIPAYVSENPTGATIQTKWTELDPTSFVDEILTILQAVRTQIESLDPSSIVNNIQSLYDEISNTLQAVNLDPISNVAGTLENFRNVFGKLDVEILIEPLQDLYDSIDEKLHDLAPSNILEEFSERFQNIQSELKNVDPRIILEDLVQEFEGILHTLREIIDTLDPILLLGKPIEDAFMRIKNILQQLYPEELLQPLLNFLDNMRDELIAALDRVEDSLRQMVVAIPI